MNSMYKIKKIIIVENKRTIYLIQVNKIFTTFEKALHS